MFTLFIYAILVPITLVQKKGLSTRKETEMGDVFIEQMVKKKDVMKDILVKCAILLAGLIILFIALVLFLISMSFNLAPFAILLVAGDIYFTWYFISGLNLEFEYIYTNGEFDFDKISAKRKRKRVVTVRVSSFEEFGPFSQEKLAEKKADKFLNLSTNIYDKGNYYAFFHDREGQSHFLLFTPNERLLEAIKAQYRRKAYGAV